MSYLMYVEKLDARYREVFRKIELYLNNTYVDDGTREEQLSELLDCLLSAQEAGKPVESVVGNDVQKFCESFCSGYDWKNRLLHFLEILQTLAWITLVLNALHLLSLLADLPIAQALVQEGGFHMSALIIGALSGVLSGFVTKKLMFRMKKLSLHVLNFVTLLVAAAAVALLSEVLPVDLLPIPVWAYLLFSLLYIIIYRIASRKRRAERAQYRVSFGQMVNEEIERTLDADMRKEFESRNAKREKKRKTLLTWEEYLAQIEKECGKMEKMKWYFMSLPLIMLAGCLVGGWAGSGLEAMFEGFGDLVFFVCIILAVTYPIMFGLWKITRKNAALRRAWLSTAPKADLSDGIPT